MSLLQVERSLQRAIQCLINIESYIQDQDDYVSQERLLVDIEKSVEEAREILNEVVIYMNHNQIEFLE